MLMLRTLALLAAMSSRCVGAAAVVHTATDEENGHNHLRSLKQTTHLYHDQNASPSAAANPLTTTSTSTTGNGSRTTKKNLVPHKTYNNMAATASSSASTSQARPSLNSVVVESEPKTKRYVVKCAAGYVDKCEDDILKTSGVQIVNYMPNTDMFAVEMEEYRSYEFGLNTHVDHVEDDPIRYLLHSRVEEDKEDYHNNLRSRNLVQNEAYGITHVNAPVVWEAYKGQVGDSAAKGSRAKVCIIDTGLRKSHTDLDQTRLFGSTVGGLTWDIDEFGHGSHVAGIIGASDNTEGVVGVSPEVNLHIVRVFDRDGIFASDLVSAMEECARSGANVISMSLGGEARSYAEELATQRLFDSGVVLVAAAGNSGDSGNPVEYPAAYESVISVGATNANRIIASFSSFNDQLTLAAPGVNIRSLGIRNDNDYVTMSGTSMACPHVAGVAALLFSIFDTATSKDVRDALQNSAHGLGQCGSDLKYGYGHVDAKAAADLLQSGGTPTPVTCIPTVVTIKPDQYGSETTWSITNSNGVPIAGGGPYRDGSTSDQVTQLNLPELPSGECYKFTIFDAQNDGLCCEHGEGSYGLTFNGATVPVSAIFTGSQDTIEFGCNNGSGPSNPDPSPVCGNGIVEAGEECDYGNNNGSDQCSNQCTIITPGGETNPPVPVCGNGILEAGEECDSGNNSNSSACTNACKNNVCGDGFVFAGVEACDSGSNNGNGDCGADCQLTNEVSCGDNFWEQFWYQITGKC